MGIGNICEGLSVSVSIAKKVISIITKMTMKHSYKLFKLTVLSQDKKEIQIFNTKIIKSLNYFTVSVKFTPIKSYIN